MDYTQYREDCLNLSRLAIIINPSKKKFGQFMIICLDKCRQSVSKNSFIIDDHLIRHIRQTLTDYTVFPGEDCLNLSRLSTR